MPSRNTAPRLVAVAAAGFLLTGCGSSAATSPGATSSGAASSSATTPAARNATPTQQPAKANLADVPSTATMVCSDELRTNVGKLLHLASAPRGHATWDGTTYTCRYDLAAGPLVLTVHQSRDKGAARAYLQARKKSAGGTAVTGLASLGLPAFQDRAGTAAFAKDDFTLVVDASKLSGTLGAAGTSRSHVAYTLATDVLACWSHD